MPGAVPYRNIAEALKAGDLARAGQMIDRNFDELTRSHEVIVVSISDETTALTSGGGKMTFRMPYALVLQSVKATVTTASSSGNPTFDINQAGTSILGTKLSIDANETSSDSATTPATIVDKYLDDDALISIDIDTAGTGTKGAKVYLAGYRN